MAADKTCTACVKPLPVAAFGPLKNGRNGLQPTCRACMSKLYRTDDYRERHRAYGRKSRATGCSKERDRRNAAATRARYPKRGSARVRLRGAILAGRVVRPSDCPKCGATDPRGRDGRTLIQGHHHKGYDNPLDVEWLCVQCHTDKHRAMKGDQP